jgi:hypothetical protein
MTLTLRDSAIARQRPRLPAANVTAAEEDNSKRS